MLTLSDSVKVEPNDRIGIHVSPEQILGDLGQPIGFMRFLAARFR
jgi:hypothetical protein